MKLKQQVLVEFLGPSMVNSNPVQEEIQSVEVQPVEVQPVEVQHVQQVVVVLNRQLELRHHLCQLRQQLRHCIPMSVMVCLSHLIIDVKKKKKT